MKYEKSTQATYGYGALVDECARRGIGRTTAFELASKGLLDTFQIGRKRMVYIASLESLPTRLIEAQGPAHGQ